MKIMNLKKDVLGKAIYPILDTVEAQGRGELFAAIKIGQWIEVDSTSEAISACCAARQAAMRAKFRTDLNTNKIRVMRVE